MTRKMKAILVLFFAAEIVNSAKVGVLKSRIADLETQRDIYASRAQNWIDRAVEDEEVIDSLQIRLAVLQVTGSIPDDATFKAEVTNNANDPSPVWQDATVEVKKGVNIVFTNSEATNGAAFNFRVSVSRGASGTGGYIEAVSGAFQ